MTGVEGGFRQAAAATLAALRVDGDTLTALLAAVLGDPLVPWAPEGREGAAARKVGCLTAIFQFCLL